MAMSELQMALIGAGTVAVGLVWGYNAWQDRQHRKAAERIFRNDDDAGAGAPAPAPGPDERREPVADPAAAAEAPTPADAAMAAGLPAELADPVADCTAMLEAADGLAAPAVWAMQAGWAGELDRPLRWFGRDDAGAWCRVDERDSGRYSAWAAVLQLVDRRGPISDGELARFCDGMQALAQQAGATATLPARGETLIRATRLDEFCASVDIQFVLHVVEPAGGMLAGARIRVALDAAGLALDADGVFRARDAAGGERFVVANLGNEAFDAGALDTLATLGVTLRLDVPRAADGVAAFDAMLVVARDLAAALGGAVVDAQRAPLAEAMVGAIRARTAELQQRLQDGGIVPGSALALRLFA